MTFELYLNYKKHKISWRMLLILWGNYYSLHCFLMLGLLLAQNASLSLRYVFETALTILFLLFLSLVKIHLFPVDMYDIQ